MYLNKHFIYTIILIITLYLRVECSLIDIDRSELLDSYKMSKKNVLSTLKHRRFISYFAVGIGRVLSGFHYKATPRKVILCEDYECYRGYCVSRCGFIYGRAKWCYMTQDDPKPNRIINNYVPCVSSKECTGCWECAGSCTDGWDLPERYY
ncbi:uncharacterized protein LOC126899093 [Daktulosphaira vitifoliae]|uniref:uncharacterized protein LOC126899093 n=1 Tax=Daktulosphaira vitifoliae TaxID=58002 RepID=UPI0021AA1711|nr:uncharacterized protein LOC126899093 [Daktulosphaira vitifoliae]